MTDNSGTRSHGRSQRVNDGSRTTRKPTGPLCGHAAGGLCHAVPGRAPARTNVKKVSRRDVKIRWRRAISSGLWAGAPPAKTHPNEIDGLRSLSGFVVPDDILSGVNSQIAIMQFVAGQQN